MIDGLQNNKDNKVKNRKAAEMLIVEAVRILSERYRYFIFVPSKTSRRVAHLNTNMVRSERGSGPYCNA